MKARFGIFILLVVSSLAFRCNKQNDDTPVAEPEQTVADVDFYLTKPDKSALLAQQKDAIFESTTNNLPFIAIDSNNTYQQMEGFGFSLTGGSALHIQNMSPGNRHAILEELFGTQEGDIGISYLRVSIGSSDLDPEVFSYDDLPAGQTDVDMEHFSLDHDREYLIPVLKEILQINPAIKIMGSPWSAPVWMKTNHSSVGGSLKPEYYEAYATYFVKYIQGMADEGITLDAITVQNEPLYGGNNPSMEMQANEQANFVKNNLGPAFQAAGIATKIIVYDHNCDRTDYPVTIYQDAGAAKYVDGAAFHLYGGSINSLEALHNAYPDKNLYFTEQWIGAPGDFGNNLNWHVRELIIGATRNWCKTVLEWNLASNSSLEPHTDGGCDQCLGGLTINNDNVVRNPGYYIVAQASKFVRPGAVRIKSNYLDKLPNVAFKNTDGTIVAIVLNDSDSSMKFNIKKENRTVTTTLTKGAVGTFIWH